MKQTRIQKWIIIAFWLSVWQFASVAIHNSIIFVGPFDMVRALITLIPRLDFWLTIAYSFGKISFGFLSAFLLAILIGSFAYRFPLLQALLAPIMMLVKSIPVAAFVILALIWTGSKNLSVLIAFLVVFPMIYINTLAGLQSTDKKLLEMAQVFELPLFKKIHYIYLPALAPYLMGGCKIALGMSWKSGIAAEVIGVPAFSIGEKLYMAKIYLNTADLFAWTFLIIVISALSEYLFLWCLKNSFPRDY